jgi:hypothetical protein
VKDELAAEIYATFIKRADPQESMKDAATKILKLRKDETGDALKTNSAHFLPLTDKPTQAERFKDVVSLIKNLETEAAEAGKPIDEYALWLIRWNTWFHQTQIKLNTPPILAATALAMAIEIQDAGWWDDAGFKDYCAKVTNPQREIFNMRKAFIDAGLSMMDLCATLHFLQQHSLPVEKLNTSTSTDIYYLSLKAPPLAGFKGFAEWGPGNNKSVPENKANHFLKHVLDAHPKENLPWQGECAVWWRTLDLKLTRQAAETGLPGFVFNLVQAHFPVESAGVLPFDKVEAVVGAVKSNGGWPQPMLQQFVSAYEDAYLATALTLSQTMTNVIVHTDAQGGVVFLMGLNGPFFVGGRMEQTTLGLSTCFVPKPGADPYTRNKAFIIWQVSPT